MTFMLATVEDITLASSACVHSPTADQYLLVELLLSLVASEGALVPGDVCGDHD